MPRTWARSTSASSAAVAIPAARRTATAASRSSPQVRIFRRKYRRAVQREPTVADVVAARRVVDRYLPRAPLERSPLLSADLGADIYLKIETFKPTRTFKVRGALNKIASLDDAARRWGVDHRDSTRAPFGATGGPDRRRRARGRGRGRPVSANWSSDRSRPSAQRRGQARREEHRNAQRRARDPVR